MTRNGYTLIELIIVIALMAILFTFGFTTFQDYSRQQALLAGVRQIQTDIRTTQEAAIAGNKPAACSTLLNGYEFNVTSSTSYTISVNCTPNTNIVVNQETMPSGLTLVAPNPNPIVFKTIAQGTNIPSGSSATITVKQTISGNSRSIVIGANGSIQ